ncbi:unnamed protein product [Blepharisma stoltei]|uniref:Uncharacterized protein n=1 Tax=Blepharisma stoltei TaxID=1481888 RepID=A0AAU9JKN0_9CILI|nr:unnamed protein product [Blepharisma stoltei]
MEDIRCFDSSCSLKPQGFCECLNETTLFCERHCFSHLQSLQDTNHKLQDLWHSPYEETRQTVINEAHKLKKDIKTSKKYLIEEYNKIFHCLNEYKNNSFSILNSVEKKANELIKAASYIKEVPTYPKVNDYQLILRLKPAEAKYRARTWRIRNHWIRTIAIIDVIKNSFKLTNISPFQEICGFYNYTENIFYFGDHTKELKEYNLANRKLIKTVLNIKETLWNNISVCYLPDGSIFCYGNWLNNVVNGTTFIVDKGKKVVELPAGKSNCDLSSVLYNDHVYCLGGVSGVSEKFCLKKKTWKSLCPLPGGNYQYSTSFIFCDILLLTSLRSNALWKYDINKNTFKQIQGLELARDFYKRGFAGNIRAYIIETSQKIYESEELNPLNWKIIGSNAVSNSYIWSFGAYYDSNLWFINSKSELIMFGLESKKFELIRKI